MRAESRDVELVSERIGSYRIEERLASGGMGVVYRAAHVILPRLAAVKVLHSDMLHSHMTDTPSAADRMLQEARILESIDHPTIVEIYDVGVLPDGRPWVAMELLDGQTLADHLFVHRRIDAREAARIVGAVGSALMRSHEAGVVHRDIKPENIMLVGGPAGMQVKVIDWGIAHLTSLAQRATLEECSPGTPCYMSPEQLRGESIDGRADVYALGVVAYEILTGDPPFDGVTPLDIAMKTINDAVPPLPAELNVPLHVEAAIRSMLAKDPMQRPSLDRVCAAFADWERQLDGEQDDDYDDIHLEVEIDVDFPDFSDFRERRCISGEIVC